MSGSSSVNVAGIIKLVTARKSVEIGVSQIIDELVISSRDILVPIATADQVIHFGDEEVLFLHMYSPKTLLIELESNDTVTGPVKLGLLGHWFLTMSPGAGITSLKVGNESLVDDVSLEIVIGQATAGEVPPYWG